MVENIVVIVIVGMAAAFLGRSYYKKYKKGKQSSCGCSSCPVDASACDHPEERQKHINEINKPAEN
jgi:hypothetical protein